MADPWVVKTFQVPADISGGSTQDLVAASGFGTVAGAIVYFNRVTAANSVQAHAQLGVGITDKTRTHCLVHGDEDNQSTTDGFRYWDVGEFISIRDPDDTAADSVATYDSTITDGIRIDWSEVSGNEEYFTVIFFSSDCSFYAGFDTINDTGTTGVGFKPDVLLGWSQGGVDGTKNGNNIMSHGVAVRDTADDSVLAQWMIGMNCSRSGQGTSANTHIIDDAQFISQTFAGSVSWDHAISTFDSDGFSLADSGGGDDFAFVAIKLPTGYTWDAHIYDIPTSGGNDDGPDIGFTPGLMFFLGTNLDTQDAAQTDAQTGALAVVMSDGTTVAGVGYMSEDAQSTSNTGSEHVTTFRVRDADQSALAVGTVTFADPYVFNWTTVPGTSRKAGVLVLGEETTASTGTSAGVATASGEGKSDAEGDGSSSGSATASAAGASDHVATGSSDGAATAAATGASDAAADGSSDGAATASGQGIAETVATGTADGVATAAAQGLSDSQADGASDGTSTATGQGQSDASADGSSDGIATATGQGLSDAVATGTADGVATATAEGVTSSTGTSDGVATVSGQGLADAVADGSSDGVATASAQGLSDAVATGTAAGSATASGEGIGDAIGTSAGSSTASGEGLADAEADGSSDGSATATGQGQSDAEATGASSGVATVSGQGLSEVSAVGTSTGTSSASGQGITAIYAVGDAAGTSTANAENTTNVAAIGTAAGLAVVTGQGLADAVATGTSAGQATATAEGIASGLAPAFRFGIDRATAARIDRAEAASIDRARSITIDTGGQA